MSGADLPPEAAGRLENPTFTSGLTVPDFAACLQMGLRPVGLVQGYCVMRWSWYGAGSPYSSSTYWGAGRQGDTLSSYQCPHGFGYGVGGGGFGMSGGGGYGMRGGFAPGVGADHRTWGCNVEQPWVTQAWASGYSAAYHRMLEEAQAAGAHGVVGVVDSASHLVDGAVREFHMYGTAVVVEGNETPPQVWSTYLAGQRLAKLVEAGFFPVTVVAAMASIRVWSVSATEILLRGGYDGFGVVRPSDEIVQVADAEMQARRVARDHLRSVLGHDVLQGAELEVGWHEISEGDFERHSTLRGTRVRRVRDADPLPAPIPTVNLR